MASDTNIKIRKKVKPLKLDRSKGSGLALRILAVNVVAPLVLVIALLYMGQYRESLIQAKLETLNIQAQLFAGAIAEGAVQNIQHHEISIFKINRDEEGLIPNLSKRMVSRLGETSDSRTRLFNHNGVIIADSHQLLGPGDVVQVSTLEPPDYNFNFTEALAYLMAKITVFLPIHSNLQPYLSPIENKKYNNLPDALLAKTGTPSATAWEDKHGRVILTAAAPIQKTDTVLGVVHLSQDNTEIDIAMAKVRFDVLTVFLGALSITIFMSIYLSGVIGRPLKRLASAAETVRKNKGRTVSIPDMSSRKDEIGDLSVALRDMTQALWDRMDSIENFAADVAHEVKNPLTSLRSAVETVTKVKTKKDRERLMNIIEHDVQRLDRLISDISNASRLDAELSREEMIQIDLRELLERLVDAHRQPLERGKKKSKAQNSLILNLPGRRRIFVKGNESRLAQVFENLISNAISFSPKDGVVTINVSRQKGQITVQIEDEGTGIPENKLEDIFTRFYTERPRHEDYGSHSGLGLSIAKQIVIAHGGEIFAENIKDENGKILGANFTVILRTG
jgi:two-component system sensor histidine kinase ChvG